MAKILLTGGGTAGHVNPNIALIPKLKQLNYDIKYIGSYDGIEKKLIKNIDIDYIGISSGKLRRYFSLKNFTDPFRVIKGYFEAKNFIKNYRPDILFSKGGFVSVPVVLAAKKYKIPIIIHESDMTPGLANKISIPYASKVCHNFPETAQYLPKGKSLLTGSPIREELLKGNKDAGLTFCGLTSDFPVILVMGGSLGASSVNSILRECLPTLLNNYQIIHICGKGKLDHSLDSLKGYIQFEYLNEELKDIFAASDMMISRAGAGAISEISALRMPSLLIPLSAKASRGDQILNAQSFSKQGFCNVLEEEDITTDSFTDAVNTTFSNREFFTKNMNAKNLYNSVSIIIDLIISYVK